MPDEEQIQSVVAEVERLQAERPDGKPWDAMTQGEKSVALGEIEWAGFSRREEMAVIDRILAREPPELWMQGIGEHDHRHDGPAMDDPLPTRAELEALAEEIRRDEHAARVRDYGEADAATYEGRVRDGADTVRHLDASGPIRDDWMARLSIDAASREELAAELDRIKRDTYVELEEQVAGWNYTRGAGGRPFHELPVTDREVLVEDYVDWGKYMGRGLTFDDQARVMHAAARDPLPGHSATGREIGPVPEVTLPGDEPARVIDRGFAGGPSDYLEALDAASKRVKARTSEKSRGPER